MDRDNYQYIIIAMIVMLIFLVLFCSCSRRTYVTPSGVSVELPRTPQDPKGGASWE